MRSKPLPWGLLIALSALLGCEGGSGSSDAGRGPEDLSKLLVNPAPAAAPAQPPPAVAPAAAAPPAVVQTPAQAGVGEKGRSLEFKLGQTAVKAYFQAKERIVFEIQLPEAMKLYQATNGYFPKTEEDFWEQIVKANFISLPELPAGHRYVYRPENGELFVEHPQ